jgi:hypothetical protein
VFDVMRIPYADLIVQSVSAAPQGSSGQPLEISWTVKNQGIGLTNTSQWSDIGPAGQRSGRGRTSCDAGELHRNGPLAPDGSYTRTVQALIPHGLTGTFYVVVDTGGPFEFIYTDNNRGVSQRERRRSR